MRFKAVTGSDREIRCSQRFWSSSLIKISAAIFVNTGIGLCIPVMANGSIFYSSAKELREINKSAFPAWNFKTNSMSMSELSLPEVAPVEVASTSESVVPVKIIYVNENQPIQILDPAGHLLEVIYLKNLKNLRKK